MRYKQRREPSCDATRQRPSRGRLYLQASYEQRNLQEAIVSGRDELIEQAAQTKRRCDCLWTKFCQHAGLIDEEQEGDEQE